MRERAARSDYNARPVILLVTDGEDAEDDCEDNANAEVVRVADAAFAGSPSIATYLFATVPNDNLDRIAAAGGTQKALLADLSRYGALSEALNDVRDREVADLPCQYTLPSEYFVDVNDPTLVALTRDGLPIAKLADSSACADLNDGWYYDDDDAPSYLLTCPETCRDIVAGDHVVEIVLDCRSVEP